MGNYKFNTFGFNFDDLGKAVDDLVNNIKVNDIFGADSRCTSPSINAIEYTTHLELDVAAPGLRKEDFDLHVENNLLTISADKAQKEIPEEAKIRRKEFNYSNFKRTFKLGTEFDFEKITARYEQGVLSIRIPKKGEDASSKIKVNIL